MRDLRSLELSPGGVLEDRFVIEREAGRGGMGVVYRAHDRSSERPVAIKVLRDGSIDDRARFLREVSLLESLRHPGIVEYVTHGTTPEGAPFLAMEWIEGEDLSKCLARGRLGVEASLLVVERIARALAFAHERNLVHRDVKPGNVLLVGGDLSRVKLVDFGIARSLERGGTLTATGAAMGTPEYMSPEQARGDRSVDARADVFALGSVLFECIVGRPAHTGDHAIAVLASILLDDAPRLRDVAEGVPPDVDALVARMTARNRSLRPKDCGAVLAELASMAQHARTVAVTSPAPTPSDLGTDRRFVSLLVIHAPLEPGASLDDPAEAGRRERLHALGVDHGAVVEIVGGATVLGVVPRAGTAREQAARAVRLAHAVRDALAGGTACVVSGHTVMRGATPQGALVERALALADRERTTGEAPAPKTPLRVDTLTAELLDGTFELELDEHGARVRGEHDLFTDSRVVLGKATPFVGREREMVVLEAALASAFSEGEVRAAVVVSEPGLGKSRLVGELCQRLRRRGGLRVASARGRSISAGSPYATLAALVSDLAGVRPGDDPTAIAAALRALTERTLPAASAARAAAVLGALTGAEPGPSIDEAVVAARADPVLFGDLLRGTVQDVVQSELTSGPLLLVVDDLQWSDLSSVLALEALGKALRDRPLMLLGAARPDADARMPDLWSALGPERVVLGPIARRAAERFVVDLVGWSPDDPRVAVLAARAEGSPLLLEELARAARSGSTLGAPASVIGTLQARLDALDPEARRVLRAASTFGDEFWTAGVCAVLGSAGREDDVAASLAELARLDLVVARPRSSIAGTDEHAFKSSLLREAADALHSDEDRRAAHARAGEWLHGAGERDPLVLARHFEAGGRPDRAGPFFRDAAARALAGGDLGAVLELCERARSAPSGAELAASVNLLEADARFHRKEIPAATSLARAALELSTPTSEPWLRAATSLIAAAGQAGDDATVAEVAQELCALEVPADETAHALAIALSRALSQLTASGRPELALVRERLHAVVLSRRMPPHVRAHAARAHATDSLVGRRMDEALGHLETCIDSYESISDARGSAFARTALTSVLLWVGDPERAREVARRAILDATRAGSTYMTDWARYALAKVLVEEGELSLALAELDHVEAALAESPRIVAGALVYGSLGLSAAGRALEAEERARRASEVGKTPAVRAGAAAARARALLGLGRIEEAVLEAERAHAILVEKGSLEEFETLVRGVHAEALHVAGRKGEARAAVGHARAILLQTADTIRSSARREAFLTRPREVASLLRHAREWLDRDDG